MEVVGVRRDDISICIFTPFDIKGPQDSRKVEEKRVVRDIDSEALATPIAKSSVSLYKVI